MARYVKSLLLALGGLAGLFVLAAAALVLFVDANSYKPRLETAASKALEMDVEVGGQLGFRFSPGLSVILNDVHIRKRGADVISAGQARLGIALSPLLRKEVRITSISAQNPRIALERDRAGDLDLRETQTGKSAPPALAPSKESLVGGTFVYADPQSGAGFEAIDCDLVIHNLQIPGGAGRNLIQELSFTAYLDCGEVRSHDLTASDLQVRAEAKNGVIDLQPVTMQVFGAPGSGSIHAEFTGAVPHFSVLYALPQFPIEEFFKLLSPQKAAEGRMDFSAKLTMHGMNVKQLWQTLAGQISLRGKNLTLKGIDLDREYARFESSQNFNLVDVGAFFFVGPLGLLVTKGRDFASIFQASEGQSEIPTLVSDWTVESGVAQARDVAMATSENRFALRGGLDFVTGQFDEVTVAPLSTEGCALVEQSVRGAFEEPEVAGPSVFKALTGPVRELFPAESAK
jgi:AsmA protein